MKRQVAIFALFATVLLAAWWVPWDRAAAVAPAPVREGLLMTQDYARHHVLLCLVPALFIAGGIAVFVSQASVIQYFGPQASKPLAYGVASISGTILAVCSCTVLPLFAGIRRMGAGLGPAVAFLYSGPAINVLAIVLTARVLGLEFGLARAVCAILFSIVIGLAMHLIFRRAERRLTDPAAAVTPDLDQAQPLWQKALLFAAMVGVLVFANWGRPIGDRGPYAAVYQRRFIITAVLLVTVVVMSWRWFVRAELRAWAGQTWFFAKQILPLLLVGVLVAGLLLGRPGHEGLIPSGWVERAVGGNSLRANLLASVAGAFMYFATLTEVPILEGLLGAGMGKGPALALLLAGPALSLPSMLVIRSVLGNLRTAVYVLLVVVMATACGMIYGALF